MLHVFVHKGFEAELPRGYKHHLIIRDFKAQQLLQDWFFLKKRREKKRKKREKKKIQQTFRLPGDSIEGRAYHDIVRLRHSLLTTRWLQ